MRKIFVFQVNNRCYYDKLKPTIQLLYFNLGLIGIPGLCKLRDEDLVVLKLVII